MDESSTISISHENDETDTIAATQQQNAQQSTHSGGSSKMNDENSHSDSYSDTNANANSMPPSPPPSPSPPPNTPKNPLLSLTADSVYDFYVNELFPAILSSFPILMHRFWSDVLSYTLLAGNQLYLFVKPTWMSNSDYHDYNNEYDNNYQSNNFLETNETTGSTSSSSNLMMQLHLAEKDLGAMIHDMWEQAVRSSQHVNATIADFMINHLRSTSSNSTSTSTSTTSGMNTNYITPLELLAKLPATAKIVIQHEAAAVESFWGWFSREWPLMDWKIGVFLWQTFGGILLIVALFSIMPGRLHTWSGKLLRWPILGLTYLLINVELVVYVIIRLGIRLIETIVANPKHRMLRNKMANDARTYQEWYHYASELDRSQKRCVWQSTTTDETSYQYNWPIIRQLVNDMREARLTKRDPILALAVLQQCTRKNVGGIMNEDLFTKTYTGEPKFIVMEFIGEVTKTLCWVTNQTLLLEDELELEEQQQQQQQQQQESLLLLLEEEREQESTKNAAAIRVKQQERAEKEYEQNLHRQAKLEQEKLWKSLVAFATLDFCSTSRNVEDDDGDDGDGGNNTRGSPRKTLTATATVPVPVPATSTKKKKSDLTRTESEAAATAASQASPRSTSTESTTSSNSNSSSGGTSAATANTAGTSKQTAINREQLLKFLKRARHAYGKTALCLSGGSMMGLYHLGHLKGLMETDCLPDIVSGCSAGSAIGAVLCTRTNDELHHDLDPQVIGPHLKCFDRSWSECIKSVWKTGNLFDGDDWLTMIKWFTLGDTTFEEAYQKTGRVLCIALAATAKKTPPILVNYISAPNVTIASAVVASAAVPGFVSPRQLQIKDPDGTIRSAGPETYFDGSIKHDIPTAGLSEMLNCHFFVACQCNPHIVPFFFNAKGGVGRPTRWSGGEKESSWRGGFLLAALEMYLKNDMRAKCVFLRDLDAAVSFTGTMMTQSFEGTTTIVPQVELRDFFTLFSDPTVQRLYRYLRVGSVAAYQHAAMIRCHYRIADALEECIEKLEAGHEPKEEQQQHKTRKEAFACYDTPNKTRASRRASFEVGDMQFEDESESSKRKHNDYRVPKIITKPQWKEDGDDSISTSSETGNSTVPSQFVHSDRTAI